MRTTICDVEVCNLADFLRVVGSADPMLLLAGLARRSALLERTEQDGALENRLALAVLANGVLHAPQGARPRDGVRADYPRLLRLANGLTGQRSALTLTGRSLTEHNCRNILRMCAQHESLLGPQLPGLARTQMLLGRILPDVLGARPSPLDGLERATGLPFPEVRAAFFALYAWMLQLDERAVPRIVPRVFGATRKAEAYFRALAPFAKTISDLAKTSTTTKAYGCGPREDFQYAFSALRDYPIVMIDAEVAMVPVARFLSLVFSDGIYDFVREHMRDREASAMASFDQVFGEVAEEYVGRRVVHELGAGHYDRLKQLKGKLSPDGIISDDCVVEIKGKRLLRGILTTGELLAATNYLGKEGLGYGVAQLLAEIGRTRSGRGRGLARERIDGVVPCLVTPDGFPGFHLAPIRRWVTDAFATVIQRDFPDLAGELPALARLEWLCNRSGLPADASVVTGEEAKGRCRQACAPSRPG